MRGGGVIISCLDCFLEGNNICLFIYSVPWWFYNVGVQDTCSMEDEDPPETVLRRANDLHAPTALRSETASTLPFTARQGTLTFHY
jgi:hypothetical protein